MLPWGGDDVVARGVRHGDVGLCEFLVLGIACVVVAAEMWVRAGEVVGNDAGRVAATEDRLSARGGVYCGGFSFGLQALRFLTFKVKSIKDFEKVKLVSGKRLGVSFHLKYWVGVSLWGVMVFQPILELSKI